MPRHRQNHCYAPGCQTGYVYVKDGPKVSFFGVPKDKSRRNEWEKNLHRADKPLDDTSALCELYFEPRFVLRDYVHIIQGKEVRIARGKPILRDDAVPTILPNLPTYLTKKLTQERTARKRKRSEKTDGQSKPAFFPSDNAVAVPFPRTADAIGTQENSVNHQYLSGAGCEECPQAPRPSPCDNVNQFYLNLEMPSVYWSKHSFPDHAGVVYCTAVLTSTAEVLSEKVVMFSESQSATCFKVLARGVLIKEGAVQSKTEAEDVLRKTASMQLCAGAVRHEDYDEALFTTKLTDHVLTRQGLYFSRNFLGHVPKQGMPCVSCLYLRRALLTRRSRAQHKITKARHNIAQRLKTAVRRNKRLSTRLADTRESLLKMEQQVAAKKADVLQEQIGSLIIPHEQQGPETSSTAAYVPSQLPSELCPAQSGAAAAKPAASRKRVRAGHDSAVLEMVKEQKMFRTMWRECKEQELQLQNEHLKLQKEAAVREDKLIDILGKFLAQ
ncbi:uncharacterized protein LOC125939711 [Dermacentor silvarum]|uniref:uncharacterized protein LOC125939711 n=1 Tax=Dermacentor silvarum TaxID=543639 RepID=UPI0021017DE8|nr:uncharacterized protein LOC125939711 [Dermacentor silvarum]